MSCTLIYIHDYTILSLVCYKFDICCLYDLKKYSAHKIIATRCVAKFFYKSYYVGLNLLLFDGRTGICLYVHSMQYFLLV